MLFVHISAFPEDEVRPTVGESLSFEVVVGEDGKEQAVRVERRVPKPRTVDSKSATIIVALLIVAAGALGYFIYQQSGSQTVPQPSVPETASTMPDPQPSATSTRTNRQFSTANTKRDPQAFTPTTEPEPPASLPITTPAVPASPQYRCDGRTYCSQMTSCAEAKFFLAHCPGTKMDGDNDGVPCEQQWCTDR